MKNPSILLALVLAFIGGCPDSARAANPNEFVVFNFDNGTVMPGRLYVPNGYNAGSGKKYPLVLFMHGQGGGGNNNTNQITDGGNIDNLLTQAKSITNPFFILAPQATTGIWDYGRVIQSVALTSRVIASYNIDPTKIYVTGLSAGGGGTWIAIGNYPRLFAAAFPISCDDTLDETTNFPNGVSATAASLVNLPIWAYHAIDDTGLAGFSHTATNINYIRAADGNLPALTWPISSGTTGYVSGYYADGSTLYSYHNLNFSEYSSGGHSINTWGRAYNEPALYTWLLSQSSSVQLAQPGDTFLFDFGEIAASDTRIWNNLSTAPTTGNFALAPVLPFAVNSVGVTRAVSLTITKPFDSRYTNGPTSGAAYPASIASDGWNAGTFSNQSDSATNHPGEILIGGLIPGASYNLTIYGASPTGAPYSRTVYTITGGNGSFNNNSSPLVTAGNLTAKSLFNSVTADVNGDIRIAIAVYQDGSSAVLGVINALEIVASGNSAALIIGTPPSPVTAGTTYPNFSFMINGFPAPTLSLTGSLPPGVSNSGPSLSGSSPLSAAGSYAATLTAHNGIGNDAIQAFTIKVTPVAVITSPSTNGSFTTTNTTTNLGGSSTTGTTSVSYTLNGSSAITATGTTSWSVSNLALVLGTNTVVVTAHSAGGDSTPVNLIITRNSASAPTIAITNPSTTGIYTAPTSPLTTLSGTVSSGVISVTWANSAGGNGSATLNGTTWSVSSIPLSAGVTNTITLTATSSSGTGTAALAVSYTTSSSLPAGWLSRDIGTASGGTSNYNSGTGLFTINGAGADIWANSDAGFQYAYQTLSGDGTIIAQVTSQQYTNGWAKAGLMIRSSVTDPTAPNAFILISPGNSVNLQTRIAQGNTTTVAGLPGYNAPVWLKLVRTNNNFVASVSTNGTNWTQVGSTTTINMPSQVYVGLAVTGHINDTAQCQVTFNNVSVSSNLTSLDIGAASGGTSSYNSATDIYTINGAGADIWDISDACQYLYESHTGDGTAIVKVNTQQNTNSWAKTGLMIRSSVTDPTAPNAFILISPSNSVNFQTRVAQGNITTVAGLPGYNAPVWLKLVRTNNNFSAFVSTNGTSWTQVGSTATINMPSQVYVGLAVTGHINATAQCQVTFSNLTLP